MDKHPIKVVFGGDLMVGRGVSPKVEKLGTEKYKERINSLFSNADISCINLECPFTKENARKYGLKSNPELIKLISGISIVNLANNHIYDCGYSGFLETINNLKKSNIPFTGVIDNSDNTVFSGYQIINIGGIRFAFIGLTSNIFFPNKNEIEAEGNFKILCIEDFDIVQSCIQKAKIECDFLFCQFHNGTEFIYYPSPAYKEQCDLLNREGCDFIIGHHSHVFGGYTYKENGLIFYSLGDFIFDSNHPMRKKSGLVTFNFQRKNFISFGITPLLRDKNHLPEFMSDNEAHGFLRKISDISKRIERSDFNQKFPFYKYKNSFQYQLVRMYLMLKSKGLKSVFFFLTNKIYERFY